MRPSAISGTPFRRWRSSLMNGMYGIGGPKPIGRVHLQRARVRAAGEADVIDVARAGQQIGDDAGLGGPMPPGIPSSPGSFRPTMKSAPHAARNAAPVRRRCAVRPSQSPPYSSSRRLDQGDRNWWNRWPCPAEISTPEKPHVLQVRRGVRDLLDQIADLRRRQRPRHRPGQIVGQRGGADRFRVAPRKMAPASGILDLPEQTAILAFHRLGEAFQAVRIVAPPHLHARQTGLMPHHAERFGHRHCGAAGGAIGVVLDQPIRHPARRRGEQAHRRVGDPVAQPFARPARTA